MPISYDPLIRLTGVSKIFHTTDVETHALSAIDLEIRAGDYVSVGGALRLRQDHAAFDTRLARFAQRGQLRPGG